MFLISFYCRNFFLNEKYLFLEKSRIVPQNVPEFHLMLFVCIKSSVSSQKLCLTGQEDSCEAKDSLLSFLILRLPQKTSHFSGNVIKVNLT